MTNRQKIFVIGVLVVRLALELTTFILLEDLGNTIAYIAISGVLNIIATVLLLGNQKFVTDKKTIGGLLISVSVVAVFEVVVFATGGQADGLVYSIILYAVAAVIAILAILSVTVKPDIYHSSFFAALTVNVISILGALRYIQTILSDIALMFRDIALVNILAVVFALTLIGIAFIGKGKANVKTDIKTA